jgi:hypothetical protein
MDTLVTHALETWNACLELRDSRTKAEANRAATNLARNSPLCGGHYLANKNSLTRAGTEISREIFSGRILEVNETIFSPKWEGKPKTHSAHGIGRPL